MTGDFAKQKPWVDADEMEVLRHFVTNNVRFLIIGGRAVQFHGHKRAAPDLDLLVERTAANWPNLQAALRPVNCPVVPFEQLSPEKKYQRKLNFYSTVEFLTDISGVAFEEAWPESVETAINGLSVRVISKAHLIRSKRGSPRHVDLQDIEALEAIP
jgi:hypothetical protein